MNSEHQSRDEHRNVLVLQHAASENLGTIENTIALASSEISPIQCFRFRGMAHRVLFHLEVSEVHIRKMLSEFADEIRRENLSGEEILGKAETYLPSLQKIGVRVFQNWIKLL